MYLHMRMPYIYMRNATHPSRNFLPPPRLCVCHYAYVCICIRIIYTFHCLQRHCGNRESHVYMIHVYISEHENTMCMYVTQHTTHATFRHHCCQRFYIIHVYMSKHQNTVCISDATYQPLSPPPPLLQKQGESSREQREEVHGSSDLGSIDHPLHFSPPSSPVPCCITYTCKIDLYTLKRYLHVPKRDLYTLKRVCPHDKCM